MSSDEPKDSAEPTPASAGSVAGVPVAWGVLRVGGSWVSILANEVQAETSRKSFAKMENWVHEVVPLYRKSTLTDKEWKAVSLAYDVLTDMAQERLSIARLDLARPYTEAASALRGIWERCK